MSHPQDIEGRGKGFIASRKIEAGELICRERAAFILSTEEITRESVAREFSSLSRDRQSQLSDLTTKTGAGGQFEIFLNNAVNTDSDSGSQQFGIFSTIARLNHSCCPNAGNETTEILTGIFL